MALPSSDDARLQLRRLPDRFSASALDRYRTCPRLFLLADVERVESPTQPSPVLCRANALHGALERFYGLPLEERDLATLHDTLRRVWPSIAAQGRSRARRKSATGASRRSRC